jgi:hypothetical protein
MPELRITLFESRSRRELYAKLVVISVVYGLFWVNPVDLTSALHEMPYYHLWLIALYFAPAYGLFALYGTRDWELYLAIGLLASLMNDLFFYPVGELMHIVSGINLLAWYKLQLGLDGWAVDFYFKGGLFTFPVWSWLMGLSIYLRIITVILLSELWLRKHQPLSLTKR